MGNRKLRRFLGLTPKQAAKRAAAPKLSAKMRALQQRFKELEEKLSKLDELWTAIIAEASN